MYYVYVLLHVVVVVERHWLLRREERLARPGSSVWRGSRSRGIAQASASSDLLD